MNSLKVWFAFLFCFFSMVASSHAYIRVSSPSGTITGRSIDVEAEVSSSASYRNEVAYMKAFLVRGSNPQIGQRSNSDWDSWDLTSLDTYGWLPFDLEEGWYTIRIHAYNYWGSSLDSADTSFYYDLPDPYIDIHNPWSNQRLRSRSDLYINAILRDQPRNFSHMKAFLIYGNNPQLGSRENSSWMTQYVDIPSDVPNGNYTVRVHAYNSSNRSIASKDVSITLAIPSPSISITSPSSGQGITSPQISVRATGSNMPSNFSHMKAFLIRPGTSNPQLGSRTNSTSLSTTGQLPQDLASGSHTIRVHAYNTSNQSIVSKDISFQYTAPRASISITSPRSGEELTSRQISIGAEASNMPSDFSHMKAFLIRSGTSNPQLGSRADSTSLSTTGQLPQDLVSGSHTIRVHAYNASNQSIVSRDVSFEFVAPPATLIVNSPTPGQMITNGTFNIDVTGQDMPSDFGFIKAIVVSTTEDASLRSDHDDNQLPNQITRLSTRGWLTSNVSIGNQTIRFRAFDEHNAPLLVEGEGVFVDVQVNNQTHFSDISNQWLGAVAPNPTVRNPSGSFGERSTRFHYGTDILMSNDTAIYALHTGQVVHVDHRDEYVQGTSGDELGKFVIIRSTVSHGGNTYDVDVYYAHLNAIFVRNGQQISQGDSIGLSGSTGNAVGEVEHIHIAYRYLEEGAPSGLEDDEYEESSSNGYYIDPEVFMRMSADTDVPSDHSVYRDYSFPSLETISSQRATYIAEDMIGATAQLPADSNIHFRAGRRVDLEEGFEVRLGSEFYATISG